MKPMNEGAALAGALIAHAARRDWAGLWAAADDAVAVACTREVIVQLAGAVGEWQRQLAEDTGVPLDAVLDGLSYRLHADIARQERGDC